MHNFPPSNCTGCSSCYSVCPVAAITMQVNNEGFLYPVIDNKKCIECGKCEAVCPVLHPIIKKDEKAKAFAIINNDDQIRSDSSSGGVFTAIAEKIIEQNGIVFGAKFNIDFEVVHGWTDTIEGLADFRGSKYVQSKIGDTHKQAENFLKQGRKVLFSGTPCQIGGLRSYLGQIYENLFCIDIVCHGVPSPKLWEKYVLFRENISNSITQRISFRLKNEGWKRYSVSFLFKNDTEYRSTLDKDLYMKAFLKDICLRPSCYACDFKGLNRQSDITLADFWGIQNILPEMDDDKGTSLVLVNSNNGQLMLDIIKNEIEYKEIDINSAVSFNSAAVKSVAHNPKRKNFFANLDKFEFDELINKYCTDKLTVKAKKKVKSILLVLAHSNRGQQLFEKNKDLISQQVNGTLSLKGNRSLTHSVKKPKKRSSFFIGLEKKDFQKIIDIYSHDCFFDHVFKIGKKIMRIPRKVVYIFKWILHAK